MKKCNKKSALVVGGSNGIGLAITSLLLEKGYYVYIIDMVEPDTAFLKENDDFTFIRTNLAEFNEECFKEIIKDESIEILMITAGFGKVAKFENLEYFEIENQFKVNTLAVIHIIKMFYEKINRKDKFYTGIMVSICGIISSPLFSSYSASKAALTKFIEAINIELEKSGTTNRILDVSPGSLKGTKFNTGNNNDLNQIKDIAQNIIEKMKNSETNYIPDYDNIYKGVIERYISNPHKFGLESYEYKIKNNREDNKRRYTVGYLSGTFDLFHIGHLNLLKKAKEQCSYLIVGVHPSAAHKGKETFIPFDERKEIVRSCKYVDKVIDSLPEDSDVWNLYKYDKLFVGSDYKGTERFNNYEKYFSDKNVEIIYFPYTKSTSSTQIRNLIINKIDSSK